MELEEFVEKFSEAVDFPEPVLIDADSVIVELKFWDSLAQLGVIVMADIEFGLTLTADDIAKCNTVRDLFLFCQSGN
jgi:acyl carrier protein